MDLYTSSLSLLSFSSFCSWSSSPWENVSVTKADLISFPFTFAAWQKLAQKNIKRRQEIRQKLLLHHVFLLMAPLLQQNDLESKHKSIQQWLKYLNSGKHLHSYPQFSYLVKNQKLKYLFFVRFCCFLFPFCNWKWRKRNKLEKTEEKAIMCGGFHYPFFRRKVEILRFVGNKKL